MTPKTKGKETIIVLSLCQVIFQVLCSMKLFNTHYTSLRGRHTIIPILQVRKQVTKFIKIIQAVNNGIIKSRVAICPNIGERDNQGRAVEEEPEL